jgi:hypothetical protein
MMRVLTFLLLAVSARATEIIGSDALQSVPTASSWSAAVNFRPGDGETVEQNPPRFSWPYIPSVDSFLPYTDKSVNRFRFKISPNSNMSSPVVDVECNYNFYNTLAPLTAGNTYYWQIEFMTLAEVHEADSAIRSFTIAADAVEWDRSDLVDEMYLAAKADHPHLLFNDSNRSAVSTAVQATSGWSTLVSAADAAIGQAYWPDEVSAGDKGAWALAILQVAFVYQMTQDADYEGAAEQLALLADYYVDNDGPITDQITVNTWIQVYQSICYGYDWLYDLMDGTQRTTVLNAIYLRTRWVLHGLPLTLTGDPEAYGYSDITGAYAGTSRIQYFSLFKRGDSHGFYNFQHGMLGALSAFGDDADCRTLFDIGINYMIGVTYPFGQGAPNQGREYGAGGLMIDGNALFTAMLADILFPEAGFDKNPFWADCADWHDRMIPVKWDQTYEPWGDGGQDAYIMAWNSVGRNLAWFTQSGAIRTHWNNQVTTTFGGTPQANNVYDIALDYYYNLPAGVTSYDKSKLFLEEGWVCASSVVPNGSNAFNDGVGFNFAARPRGSEGGHSSYCDGNFEFWAYGGVLTMGGNGINSYSHVPWASNTICINGLGQVQPQVSPLDEYYARIIAYKTTDNYTYTAADLTEAYPDEVFVVANTPAAFADLHDGAPLPGLTKVQRHVLFMHGKYFVVFDDLANGATAATWSWVYHILPDTLSGSPTTTFDYTVPGSGGDVAVYVKHIGTGAGITTTHLETTDVASNPITAEDYYDQTFVPRKNHVMWVSSADTATTFTFMTVIFPVAPGGAAPTITRVDDKTVTVVHAGSSIDETISFDPANVTADFVVNPEAASEGGVSNTLTAPTVNATTVNNAP